MHRYLGILLRRLHTEFPKFYSRSLRRMHSASPSLLPPFRNDKNVQVHIYNLAHSSTTLSNRFLSANDVKFWWMTKKVAGYLEDCCVFVDWTAYVLRFHARQRHWKSCNHVPIQHSSNNYHPLHVVISFSTSQQHCSFMSTILLSRPIVFRQIAR